MYILLSILSSFFIHKSLYAKDLELQYAFFVPTGAFQENTAVEDIKLQARYPKKDIDSTQNTKDDLSPQNKDKNYLRRKISLPVEHPKLKQKNLKRPSPKSDFPAQDKPKKHPKKPHKQEPSFAPEIKIVEPILQQSPSKASEAYELEENIPVLTAEHIIIGETQEEADSSTETKPALNTTQEMLLADVEDLLKTIERVDSSKPLFQQLYALYGIELRSFYRHKELPPNLSLDDTLQKANSLLRFEVK